MKKSSLIGITISTIFYSLCGLLGYGAFGNKAPGNFLTGFGFYEPYWLVDIGNLFIIIHLVGAYQVNYLFYEQKIAIHEYFGKIEFTYLLCTRCLHNLYFPLWKVGLVSVGHKAN